MDTAEFDAIEESLKAEEKPLPEAALSVHIDAYLRGFHTGITIRKNDNTVIPVSEIVQTITRLISSGFEPSWNKETTNGHLKAQITPMAQDVVDLVPVNATCPVHGTQMEWKTGVSKATGKPYAFWGCPTRNADGSYCRAGSQRK